MHQLSGAHAVGSPFLLCVLCCPPEDVAIDRLAEPLGCGGFSSVWCREFQVDAAAAAPLCCAAEDGSMDRLAELFGVEDFSSMLRWAMRQEAEEAEASRNKPK